MAIENFRVTLSLEGKWTPKQKRKAYIASKMMARCVCSGDLKNALDNFSFTYYARPHWYSIRKKAYTTRLMVNEENWPTIDPKGVYQRILNAAELQSQADGEADIILRMESTDLVGYTYPNVLWQVVGDWVINSWTSAEIAGNLMHEWLHKILFGHSYRRSSMWGGTVPYWVGNKVAAIAKLIPASTIKEWEDESLRLYP